jgi:glutathione S-transferase
VRIFLAEKGVELPLVQVDLRSGEHLTEVFRAKSPRCTVPVLELDDGSYLAESLAICDLLESLYPKPPLMGTSPLERARVLQWNAWIEQDGFIAAAEALRNRASGLAGRALTGAEGYEQIPALAERGRRRTIGFYADLDAHLADRRFVAGDAFTLADISALVTVEFGSRAVAPPDSGLRHLQRWHTEVATRPSASA